MRRSRFASLLKHAQGPAVALAVLATQSSAVLAETCTSTATAADTGTVWWSEIMSADPGRTRDFYTSVAGWTPKTVAAMGTMKVPNTS